MRELSRQQQRYLDAISELEAARHGLNDEVTLLGWIDRGEQSEASSALGGGTRVDDRPVLGLDHVVAELRRDAEWLAAQPDTPRDDREVRIALERVTTGAVADLEWRG